MVQPINYMGMMPRQDFGKRFLEGLQIGGALGELSQAEKQRTDAAALKVQYATDLEKVLQNPSMKAFNELALTYPTQREVIKDVAGRFTQEQLDSEFDSGAQVAVALENQNPDVALNILNKTIAARKQSNLPTTTQDQIQAILANTEDPDRVPKAQRLTNFALTLLNPEKFGKIVDNLSKLRPEEGFSIIPEQERREIGLDPGVFQRNNKTGEIKPISKGPLVVVETGSKFGPVPEGMERYTDDAGVTRQRVIPGSKLEIDQMQEAAKVRGRKEQLQRAGGTVVQDLQRALTIVETVPGTTGRQASITLSLPEVARAETQTQAAKAFVESALSNVGLDTLQTMRENSPTGGALGQVPIQQQQRLEQVLGSLDLTQRKEVVQDNLRRVINIYMDIIHGSPPQINKRFESGEISANDRDAYAFRYKLSFDEFGKPLRRDGRRQDVRPDAPTRDAPSQRSITVDY